MRTAGQTQVCGLMKTECCAELDAAAAQGGERRQRSGESGILATYHEVLSAGSCWGEINMNIITMQIRHYHP